MSRSIYGDDTGERSILDRHYWEDRSRETRFIKMSSNWPKTYPKRNAPLAVLNNRYPNLTKEQHKERMDVIREMLKKMSVKKGSEK